MAASEAITIQVEADSVVVLAPALVADRTARLFFTSIVGGTAIEMGWRCPRRSLPISTLVVRINSFLEGRGYKVSRTGLAEEEVKRELERKRSFERARTAAQSLRDGQTTVELDSVMRQLRELGWREENRSLFPYQKAGVLHALNAVNAANFSVPGSGKTTTTLAIAATHIAGDTIDLVIVVGPALLVTNPASTSESVSLHQSCHNAIYLDRTYDCALFLQSIDRIHRLGLRAGQSVEVHIILATHSGRITIDHLVDDGGNLHCPTRFARTGAPQLLGMLESWNEVKFSPEVFIPAQLLDELNSVWALLPPPSDIPKWAAERKEVGNRAEMYTVQFERTRVGATSIFWVARDSDSLGWDVEDRSMNPYRCIEVKGRRETEVLFYLSENEWSKAQTLGPNYEVQFWGGIDLMIDPAVEYSKLRASGYPIVITNLAAELRNTLEAVAVNWRITRRLPPATPVHPAES